MTPFWPVHRRLARFVVATIVGALLTAPAVCFAAADPGEHEARGSGDATEGEIAHAGHGHLSDEPIPLQLEEVPTRPDALVDLGNDFLGGGELSSGFELPTGAWWQPALLAFGSWRNAVQTFEGGSGERTTELRTRMDLFFNLQLSGTERLMVGFQPLDEDGSFTRYVFEGSGEGELFDELNGEISSLFFEGDFGEIFPRLSDDDFKRTDVGFAVGRQPLVFQDGQLIGDTIDAVGVTRNTLLPSNTSNFRATLLLGWNEIHRQGVEDDDATLTALLTSTDLRRSTLDFDVVHVDSDGRLGDQLSAGLSLTQRIGLTNTTFRLLGTLGLGDGRGEGLNEATVGIEDGLLLFGEVSRTPHHTKDHAYVNGFVAIDDYVPPARDPSRGGPLTNAGISFAGAGLGFRGALSSDAADVAGFAVGYQKFSDDRRTQVTFEAGARYGLAAEVPNEIGGTVRFQQAIKQHYVLVIDGFAGHRETLRAGDDQTISGLRIELLTKF